MSDLPDFDLDSKWLDPSAEGPSPATPAAESAAVAEEARPAEPVVVIQYRNRGISPILLFPITLVASLALFAGYHHFFVRPIFTNGGAFAALAAPAETDSPQRDGAVERASATEPPRAVPAVQPLSLESQPLGPIGPIVPLPPPVTMNLDGSKPFVTPPLLPLAQPADPPKAEPESPPVAEETKPESRVSIASTARDPVKEDPPAAPAEALPEPAMPTREEMMERIRQEVELKELQEKEKERRQAEALAQFQAEGVQRQEDERTLFHKALQDLVAAGGREVGKAIDDLCDQFGRVYSQEKKEAVKAALGQIHGRASRSQEVMMLRTLGIPEPGVLDYISNEIHRRSLHARNGPQNTDEVRLLAAKELLRIGPAAPPLRETRPANVRRSPSRSGR